MCFDSSWNTSSLYKSGYHIRSQWLPSPDQIDLSSTSEAIWIHNLAEHATMYSTSVMLGVMLDCSLLCHEIMADPRLKQHLEVLFLSETLPAQSESIYPYNPKS
jgi:hypothetical protein